MPPPFPLSPVPNWYRNAQWKAAWSKRNGVHYVGDDVVIDMPAPGSAYDTFKRTAIFDNGTNGAAISASERGYYSKVGEVFGSPTYSSTHAYGTLAMRVPAGFNQYVRWDYVNTILTSEYLRLYLYATAFPSNSHLLLSGEAFSIGIDTSGRPVLGDQASQVSPMTSSIALNQWVRIEAHLNYGTQVFECKLFNSADSVTPTETKVQSPSQLPSNSATRIGNHSGRDWGSDIWIDNVVLAASAYPGPFDPNEAIASPITYTVRNSYGSIVSTGTFDEHQAWFRPTPPAGGWQPGWYRVYLTGSQTDALFNNSYGATNFCVVRSDSHFVSMPAASTPDGSDVTQDLVMKGVMGLGTSRLSVQDAANPNIPNLQSDLAITKTYWTGVSDPARPPREPWIDFPNGAETAQQLAGVSAVVAALYPECKYFEGPSNEPAMNAALAAKMEAFADAVHAGHPNAQAIGPASVDISNLAGWRAFLNAGGGEHCDGISFHAYNAVTNGDLNLGRAQIGSFLAMLASYGYSTKPLWQTESTHVFTSVYRIYHPRRARVQLMETLLFEQYGVPRERNNPWYDVSHGFWDYPAWLENEDGSLEPQAVLGRVLAEETWGKPFRKRLDLGEPGNKLFLGSLYGAEGGAKTIVLMPTSYMDDASVTLSISGTNSVGVVDGWGNAETVPVPNGRLTVDLTENPSYVELPAGASATVHHCMNWPRTGLGASKSPMATTYTLNSTSYPLIADGEYMTDYAAGVGIAPVGPALVPPATATLLWPKEIPVARVLIWCGPCWQLTGALVDFDVETSTDGATWTRRKTVTKSTPSSFHFGTNSTNSGCWRETYWDEQWVFDVKLPAVVNARGVRLTVRAASYGGEPDSISGDGVGQGSPTQALRFEEIGVYSEGAKRPGRKFKPWNWI